MRWLIFSVVVVSMCLVTQAHHPDRASQRIHPYYDLIPPLGSRLPPSYRRKYNRPSKIGGKIAYYIAPSSQEAMAWHNAKHRCYYKDHRPRIVMQYFYPKPWEAMRVGPRTATSPEALAQENQYGPQAADVSVDAATEEEEVDLELMDSPAGLVDPDAAALDVIGQPIIGDGQLIEQ